MQINVTIIQDGKQAIARSFETMESAADYLNEMAGRDIEEELLKEPTIVPKLVFNCDFGDNTISAKSINAGSVSPPSDEISPTQAPKPSFIKRLFNV